MKYRRLFVSCLQMYSLSKQPICMYNEELLYFRILSDNLDSLKSIIGGGVIILRGSIFFVRVCANDTYSTVEK